MLKVSIITPSFNAEKTIEKTIKSVLTQSYIDLEYIIVDGASRDKTIEIVNKYKDKIASIISEPDRGIADAYNKGIKTASGDLIGIVAADDELLPNALQRLIDKYGGVSDVVSGGLIIKHDSTYRFYNSSSDLSSLELATTLWHPATYIRKKAYEKYGFYSTQYKCAMDRELFLRFYRKNASFQTINEYLTLFSMNGVSAKRPYANAFKEDVAISLCYGVSKIKTYKFYIKRVILYLIGKILKAVGLWEILAKFSRKKMLSEEAFYSYIRTLEMGYNESNCTVTSIKS